MPGEVVVASLSFAQEDRGLSTAGLRLVSVGGFQVSGTCSEVAACVLAWGVHIALFCCGRWLWRQSSSKISLSRSVSVANALWRARISYVMVKVVFASWMAFCAVAMSDAGHWDACCK